VKSTSISYGLLTLILRAGLIVALFAAGWLVYSKLPRPPTGATQAANSEATLQIVLRQSGGPGARALDIPVELYPVDIVAVHHEYFTERRAGKRFDDFLNERMKGRRTITAKLDKQGQASVVVSAGNWWVHAQLTGEEELEWRLPISVAGGKQTVELTLQNVYTRARSF
jgi:hypothetical protein